MSPSYPAGRTETSSTSLRKSTSALQPVPTTVWIDPLNLASTSMLSAAHALPGHPLCATVLTPLAAVTRRLISSLTAATRHPSTLSRASRKLPQGDALSHARHGPGPGRGGGLPVAPVVLVRGAGSGVEGAGSREWGGGRWRERGIRTVKNRTEGTGGSISGTQAKWFHTRMLPPFLILPRRIHVPLLAVPASTQPAPASRATHATPTPWPPSGVACCCGRPRVQPLAAAPAERGGGCRGVQRCLLQVGLVRQVLQWEPGYRRGCSVGVKRMKGLNADGGSWREMGLCSELVTKQG